MTVNDWVLRTLYSGVVGARAWVTYEYTYIGGKVDMFVHTFTDHLEITGAPNDQSQGKWYWLGLKGVVTLL